MNNMHEVWAIIGKSYLMAVLMPLVVLIGFHLMERKDKVRFAPILSVSLFIALIPFPVIETVAVLTRIKIEGDFWFWYAGCVAPLLGAWVWLVARIKKRKNSSKN